MAIQHQDKFEAADSYVKNLEAAVQHDKWMAVAVAVEPDGTLHLHRTTYDFPIDKFDEVIEELRKNLDRERGGHRPTPLPLAAHLANRNNGGMDTHEQHLRAYSAERDAPDQPDKVCRCGTAITSTATKSYEVGMCSICRGEKNPEGITLTDDERGKLEDEIRKSYDRQTNR